ncbi:MAG: hypothetical protein BMS9Abin05_0490 [Rhodothermia bacterium]|nr:MAG: hypothetical protein BMS9Abin05_0490 [Rhodothermia bacterium]
MDVAALPEPLRKFLLFTISASLYAGVFVIVVIMALATSDVLSVLMESGLTEFSSLIAEFGNLFLDVTAPA